MVGGKRHYTLEDGILISYYRRLCDRRGRASGYLYVYRAGKRRLLGHSCGYYVLLEGGREDQSACRVFKEMEIFVKLPRAKKGEGKKRKETEGREQRYLGKYSRERKMGEKRWRERDELGGGPRPRSDKLVALDRNNEKLYPPMPMLPVLSFNLRPSYPFLALMGRTSGR